MQIPPPSTLFWLFFPRAFEQRVLLIEGVCQTFASSHPLIFSSSHPHLHIFSSSHLRIFSSSHLLIFSSAHLFILSSSHLHIFSSSHLTTFSSSYLHTLSCPLALLQETQPFRTKWGSIAKDCSKIGICTAQITILPQFLAIEPHFVRKGCAGHVQVAILPQFFAIKPIHPLFCNIIYIYINIYLFILYIYM